MEKILLLTDSACDLSAEQEEQYGIRVLNMPLCVRGEAMTDRVDISTDEIYHILNTETELPTTAHLNMVDFAEAYKAAADEGYNHIIYVGINSKGSATYDASLMGKKLFYENCPEYTDTVKIYNIDSLSYSYGYGYPLMNASKLLRAGGSAEEIVRFMTEYFDHRELFFSMYTLKFAKRSGRISAAASFVGDMLGLRPIMSFPEGKNVALEKVRGDKNVVLKLFELYKENVDPQNPEYVVLHGEDTAPVQELISLVKNYNGLEPMEIGKMGICVAINAGPQIVGISFRGKNGGKYSAEVN